MQLSGDIRWPDSEYSGGVRQEIARLWGNHTAFAINRGDTWRGEANVQARRNATFCLAPSGVRKDAVILPESDEHRGSALTIVLTANSQHLRLLCIPASRPKIFKQVAELSAAASLYCLKMQELCSLSASAMRGMPRSCI